ncbi:hypothetical protein LSTR_LSTR016385 [Laodelphax striatellus]|uniref:Uncharacterized protein n=1 Tax=Laodelphax striatellus TaxID=195883 RepID=A0A482XBC8_LAOST|nr:hypothetical protein LSTR_LSTR016385 [Laodelphax striatellus]
MKGLRRAILATNNLLGQYISHAVLFQIVHSVISERNLVMSSIAVSLAKMSLFCLVSSSSSDKAVKDSDLVSRMGTKQSAAAEACGVRGPREHVRGQDRHLVSGVDGPDAVLPFTHCSRRNSLQAFNTVKKERHHTVPVFEVGYWGSWLAVDCYY